MCSIDENATILLVWLNPVVTHDWHCFTGILHCNCKEKWTDDWNGGFYWNGHDPTQEKSFVKLHAKVLLIVIPLSIKYRYVFIQFNTSSPKEE